MQLSRPQELFPLFARVSSLPGVGDKLEEVVTKKMGGCVIDVLRHLPHNIIDRSARPSIEDVADRSVATFEVEIVRHDWPRQGSRQPLQIIAQNETGVLQIPYFNKAGNAAVKFYPIGSRRLVSGRVERYRGKLQMSHPDYNLNPANAGDMPTFEPVYSLTAGLTPKMLLRMIATGLQRVPELAEWIPPSLMKEREWPDFAGAMRDVHFPKNNADLCVGTPSRTRLAFDELLANQLALDLLRKRKVKTASGRVFAGTGELTSAFEKALPFELTGAQRRAIEEVRGDQTSDARMLRMLQGDVGSGKTVVALAAMLHVIESGAQAALLAPTEILARQHHATMNRLLAPIGIESRLLLGQGRAKGRKAVIEDIASGNARLVVGTHALISESVEYHDLGLAVIDEQHRFGVGQRMKLAQKGKAVDLIAMTATPIPRSLVMTIYGDLEHSRIDEKPKGRLPIETRQISHERLGDVVMRLKAAVDAGRRAYWICPLVEDSEKIDIAAAESRHKTLREALPGVGVELVHGKMKADQRDVAMSRFRDGEAKVLVATTVVEVGVDVPEASIMIIEHAERFGLAQLHQLRGRVGRGETASACLLMFQGPLSQTAAARLEVICKSEDGFEIAERDLELRGEGEVLGQRQSGMPEFALVTFPEHGELIPLARKTAQSIVGDGLDETNAKVINLLLSLFERDSAVQYLTSG